MKFALSAFTLWLAIAPPAIAGTSSCSDCRTKMFHMGDRQVPMQYCLASADGVIPYCMTVEQDDGSMVCTSGVALGDCGTGMMPIPPGPGSNRDPFGGVLADRGVAGTSLLAARQWRCFRASL